MPNQPTISINSRIIARLDNQLIKLQVVSIDDVDVSTGKISYQSPVGQALLGKAAGKQFEIILPNESKIRCEIVEILND